ncbi:MAG: carboxypeptidase regulatory-like domain-containing protein, partial [Myxococcales bacterium]|nr:carboxypeptidase regulatory-like domain-containing protein [Myxococcales bacterium]
HDARSVNVGLLPKSGVLGTVTDGAGKPVTAVAVTIRCPHGDHVARTAGDGSFRWARPDKPCDATAVHPQYAAAAETSLVPGQPATLRLGLGGSVVGAVWSGEDKPVPAAIIRIEKREVRGDNPLGNPTLQPVHSQPDGGFRMGPLRPGRYTLRAAAKGYPPGSAQTVTVREAETQRGIRLVLDGGVVITGTVLSPTGQPVAGARVKLTRPGSTTAARTDSHGRYRIGPVAGGGGRLWAQASAGLPTHPEALILPERGQLQRDLHLRAVSTALSQPIAEIGATLIESPDGIVVHKLTAGSPAEQAGIAVGERIVSVDFQGALDLGITNMAKALGGASVQVTAEVRGANGHVRTVYLEPASPAATK